MFVSYSSLVITLYNCNVFSRNQPLNSWVTRVHLAKHSAIVFCKDSILWKGRISWIYKSSQMCLLVDFLHYVSNAEFPLSKWNLFILPLQFWLTSKVCLVLRGFKLIVNSTTFIYRSHHFVPELRESLFSTSFEKLPLKAKPTSHFLQQHPILRETVILKVSSSC